MWGAATLVPGLIALVLALQQGSDWGWSSPLTVGLLAAAAVLIVAFGFIEPRVREPIVELRLFLGRNFAGNNAVLFLVQFALVGMTVFGAIFAQDILGFSSIEAVLSMLAVTLPLLVLAPLTGGIYDRIGLMMGPSNTDAMSAAAAEFRAQAQGVIQTMRQVGATIGLAIMGVVVTQVENARLESSLSALGLPESAISQVENVLSKGADGQQEAARGGRPGLGDRRPHIGGARVGAIVAPVAGHHLTPSGRR